MGCVKSIREALVEVAGIHIIEIELETGRFEFSLLQEIELQTVINLIPAKFTVLTQDQYLARQKMAINFCFSLRSKCAQCCCLPVELRGIYVGFYGGIFSGL